MNFDLAGHVLEPSSSAWRGTIGSIHNQGHGVFGTNQLQVSFFFFFSGLRLCFMDPDLFNFY